MAFSSRYHLLRPIRRGGSAEVWEATAQAEGGFERRVAVKRLLPEHADGSSSWRGFLDEARIVSRLHHANIVSVIDFGLADGCPFQVLELVDGLDLETLALRAEELGLVLPVELALYVCREIAHALSYAHTAIDENGVNLGIVHRDVSPENILVSFAGDLKLADFGIALAEGRSELTAVGLVKGKPGYMAPEQMLAEDLDGRADVFGLGCVLHRLTSKSSLLGDESVRQKLLEHLDPPLDSGLPPDVSHIVRRATRARRKDRHPSAAALANELSEALLARQIHDPRSSLSTWLKRFRPPSAEPVPARLAALLDLEPLCLEQSGSHEFTVVLRGPSVRPVLEEETDAQKTEATLRSAIGEDESTDRGSDPELAKAAPVFDDTGSTDGSTATGPVLATATSAESERPVTRSGESDPKLIGRVLNGYELLEKIGSGGTSEVFRAQHRALKREAAVKILKGHSLEHRQQIRRLEREASALAKLTHPNIVGVIDFGTMEDGQPFLTTELIRGRSLHQIIVEDSPLELSRALSIGKDIAAGLAAAHRAGVIHRDIKPGNVMVEAIEGKERARILDFGIARLTSSELTKLTEARTILGTPLYIAPEQIVPDRGIDPRADIYSLGCVLYQMIAHRPPFQGSILELLDQHVHRRPDPLSGSRELAALVESMLEKDPARRPSAEQTLVGLKQIQKVKPNRKKSPAARPALADPSGVRLGLVLSGSLSAALLVLLGLSLLRSDEIPAAKRNPPPPGPAEEAVPRAVSSTIEIQTTEEVRTPAEKSAKVGPFPQRPVHKVVLEKNSDPNEASLKKKLRRVADRLSELEGRVAPEAIESFSGRYFELRERNQEGLGRDQLKELDQEILALERDLSKLKPAR